MSKQTKMFLVISASLLFLTGCISTGSTESPEKKVTTSTEEKGANSTEENKNESMQQENKTDEKYNLEQKLLPPKFFIKNFNATYNKKTKEIIYQMEYQMDLDIYESLTIGNQEIYFALIYPESIQKHYGTVTSELVESIQPNDNKLNYEVLFKQKIIGNLSENDIQSITSKLEGYNLNIVDKDKDVISIFNDIFGYIGYQPGLSNTEHFDETDD